MQKLARNPRGALVPVPGERTPIRLVNSARTNYITLVARATATIAGAPAASIRNRGSVFALFDEIVIDENGTDKMVIDGRVLRFLSEMYAPSALSAKRLASTAVGVTQLEEAVRIYFSQPLALDPLETAFVEADSRQVLNVSVRAAAQATQNTRLGETNTVISGVTINVIQAYEEPGANGVNAPLFIPTARQQIVQIAGAVSQQPEFIRTTRAIRAIVVTQETTTVGEVGDIITSLALRGDYRTIVGPNQMSFKDLLLDSEFEGGGAVVSSNLAHLGFNFQRYGRLSDVLNPQQDTNLRFEFTAAPSASAGTSQIRITLLELDRDPRVTAPAVPFPY